MGVQERNKGHSVDQALDEQFATGRLYACISSRPGQCGRCDGYILEVLSCPVTRLPYAAATADALPSLDFGPVPSIAGVLRRMLRGSHELTTVAAGKVAFYKSTH